MLRTIYTLLFSLLLLIGAQVHGEEPAAPEQGAPPEIKAEDPQVPAPDPETTPLPEETPPAAPVAPEETPVAPPPPSGGDAPPSSSAYPHLRVAGNCATIKDGPGSFLQTAQVGECTRSRAKGLEPFATLTETCPDGRPERKYRT